MRLTESASSGWLWRAAGCGGLTLLGLWCLGILLEGVFTPLRLIGQSVTCQSQVFRLTRAHLLYADDYDDHLPPAANWMERTMPYVIEERRLHCPTVSLPGESRYGYAMNRDLGGKARSKIESPDETPLVYDSTNLSWSAADAATSLPKPGRHITKPGKNSPSRIGSFVGYAGGNARIKLDAR